MSFVKAVRLSFGMKNLLWSLLWLVVPLVNAVTMFFFAGFLVRVIRQCELREYKVSYTDQGMLFVQGLFALSIGVLYVLPGIVVLSFSKILGGVLLVIGVLFAAAAIARFAVTESFGEAFSRGVFVLLMRARFWIAFVVWALVAGVSGLVAIVVMVWTAPTLAIPVLAFAVWIVVCGSVGAGLLGHAQN